MDLTSRNQQVKQLFQLLQVKMIALGYNGADLVKEGSVMSHDGLAGLMLKMDESNK